MSEKLKPVNYGCGGEAKTYKSPINRKVLLQCSSCGIETKFFNTEAEVIQAWNTAMGAKDINVPNKFATDINVGNKTTKFKQDGEFLRCGKCNHIVDSGYKYCPNCGCRLEFK